MDVKLNFIFAQYSISTYFITYILLWLACFQLGSVWYVFQI